MPATLDDLLTELRAIRVALESKPASAPPVPLGGSYAPASRPSGGKFDDEAIPQPSPAWDLADAENHEVHFGKNAGVRIGDLKDTSLAFYAKEKPPQMKRDGKTPFEKRKADIDLENASRTVWHHRRGTLAAGATPPARRPAATPPPAAANQNQDDDVPF